MINEHVKTVDLISSQTFLDFDAIFIFGPEISAFHHPQAFVDRKNQIFEFLQLGRTVVVFPCIGNIQSLLPISLSMKACSGQRIEFKGPDYLKTFWESIKSDMQYLTYFEKAPGLPFLFVPQTNKALATLVKIDRGHILFLPWLKPHNAGPIAYEQACTRFITAFQKLVEHISPKKLLFDLPPWSVGYNWTREKELRSDLDAVRLQIEQLSVTLASKTKQLQEEERLKILFTAKGDALADVVIEVFQELGVKVTTPPKNMS